jgi:hypothetical protein
MAFVPIKYAEGDIGGTFRGTKRRFQWYFDLGKTSYHLLIDCSRLTNRRKILLNNE